MDFPIWKTIVLGTGLRTADNFRFSTSPWIHINRWVYDMFEQPSFVVIGTKTKVDLVNVSLEDLGIDRENVSYEQATERAIELGMRLCPPEVGPQLRVQYLDQPRFEWLTIGMKIFESMENKGYQNVFYLGNRTVQSDHLSKFENRLELLGAGPGYFNRDSRLIFLPPIK